MTRVALVTGAGRGIGAATVRLLASTGWAVVALDACADDPALPYPMATRADLEALAAAGVVTPVVGDARDADVLQHAVTLAEARYGGLDAALAVAGVIGGGQPLWEMAPAAVDAVLSVDLGAVVSLARVAVPALLRRGAPRSGRFVAVASAAATRGMPGLTAYCAAKAGVTGLIRGLAMDLAGTGVTANAVSPGSTDTAMLAASARLYALPGTAGFAEQQPALGRLITPEEVAAVLAFLAGPDAAAVTGAVLPVDGGLAL
jgi:SDR family mycofactocin-dependent oxidoreductase